MSNILKYIAYLSVILNIFYLTLWIFVFNRFETQQERVENYSSFVPFGLSIAIADLLLIVLTILSIIAFTRRDVTINKVLIVVQTAFLCQYVWQFL